MTLNRVKLRRAVTFMKYLASVVSLIFLPKTLIWNKIRLQLFSFTESCRAGGKRAYERYLQKNYQYSFSTPIITACCKDF